MSINMFFNQKLQDQYRMTVLLRASGSTTWYTRVEITVRVWGLLWNSLARADYCCNHRLELHSSIDSSILSPELESQEKQKRRNWPHNSEATICRCHEGTPLHAFLTSETPCHHTSVATWLCSESPDAKLVFLQNRQVTHWKHLT